MSEDAFLTAAVRQWKQIEWLLAAVCLAFACAVVVVAIGVTILTSTAETLAQQDRFRDTAGE